MPPGDPVTHPAEWVPDPHPPEYYRRLRERVRELGRCVLGLMVSEARELAEREFPEVRIRFVRWDQQVFAKHESGLVTARVRDGRVAMVDEV